MHRTTTFSLTVLAALVLFAGLAKAAPVTDPNDPRTWQGATVGTFAALYYGSDTPGNRALVIASGLLDDSYFDAAGYLTGSLLATPWALGGGAGGHAGGSSTGISHDLVGAGGYAYSLTPGTDVFEAANTIDNKWFQSSSLKGETVFDLGFQATKAAVFNTVDHGPLPQEAIESTIYLSNGGGGDPTSWSWTEAVVEKVWLEGFQSNLGIEWDGFTYAVGTSGGGSFRYASVIWGGPGALIADGDNEINGIMGLRDGFIPTGVVPLPSAALAGFGLLGVLGLARRFRRRS